MGSVAVTFRILPEDAEADLEPVKARVRKALGGALRDLKEQPVAFGLKAILAIAVVGDRSEERRVGKECRSGRARDQLKKKTDRVDEYKRRINNVATISGVDGPTSSR